MASGARAEPSRRAAVFLDRDGTVIEDRHYLGDPAGVRLLPGAGPAIALLNRAGMPVLLVTNQSGIGRGYFSEDDFRAVQSRLSELLGEAGAHLDGVYHCPHAPDAEPACDCRKPKPGLFLRAAAEHQVDLARSYFVGDRVRDVEPAAQFGGTAYLVRAEGAGTQEVEELADDQVLVVSSLLEAAEGILRARAVD